MHDIENRSQNRANFSKVFLGNSQPLLSSASQWLITNLNTSKSKSNQLSISREFTDLQGCMCVVPSKRAARRLLANLAYYSSSKSLIPPTIVTPGEVPELLLDYSKLGIISDLEEQLVWLRVLSKNPELVKKLYSSITADAEFDQLLSVVSEIRTVVRELAGYCCNPIDLYQYIERMHLPAEEIWEATSLLYQAYLEELSERKVKDRDLARNEVLAQQINNFNGQNEFKNLVLIGTLELNQVTRKAISKLELEVISIIGGDPQHRDGYDEFGAVIVDYWLNAEIDLPRIALSFTYDGEHSASVVGELISRDMDISLDNFVLCCPIDETKSEIEKELSVREIPVRDIEGASIGKSSPLKLLSLVKSWIANPSRENCGSLLRHPEFYSWISKSAEISPIGSLLKDYEEAIYFSLPVEISKRGLSSHSNVEILHKISGAINKLLSRFRDSLSLIESCELLADLLNTIFGDLQLNPALIHEKLTIDALAAVNQILDQIAHSSFLSGQEVSMGELISFINNQLADKTIEPLTIDSAVEFRGWLEIPLEEARNISIVGINEGYLPESRTADRYLPDSLRKSLGLPCNDSRFARDCAILTNLTGGYHSLNLIVARHNKRGEPLLPSRLLLTSENAPEIVLTCLRSTNRQTRPSSLVNSTTQKRTKPSLHRVRSAPLSPTAFEAYDRCPFTFYLERVLGLKTASDRGLELDPVQFGSIHHEVLKMWGVDPALNRLDNERKLSSNLIELFDCYSRERFGLKPSAPVLLQLELCRQRLRRFSRFQSEHRSLGWEIAFVEKRFDGKLKHLDEIIPITGVIDRVDRHSSTGSYLALDYKTRIREDDANEYHRSKRAIKRFQLPIYRELLIQNGIGELVETGLVLIDGGDETRLSKLSWTPDEYDQAIQVAASIGSEIISDKFWPPRDTAINPRIKEIVQYAEYLYDTTEGGEDAARS